jgi:hypothetical protein
MNRYQRKTLFVILAINVVFGLQQFFINQAVVFPSPINAVVFIVATLFFFVKTFFSASKLEKLLLFLFVLVAAIQFISDSFVMEIALSSNHEQVYDWINSWAYQWMQILGVGLLLATIPIIAHAIRGIRLVYFYALLACFALLVLLAFFKISLEPLFVLGLISFLFVSLLWKHNEQILSGVSASMYLWIIFFFHEAFDYWNLSL